MTLLITGAAGAIGTRLAADLAARNIPLRLLDRRRMTGPAGVDTLQVDLRDLVAVERAVDGTSAVIHLAAITEEAPFAEMIEHNIIGTHHVLEAARRSRVPRVVVASSHHVTGLNPIGGPQPTAPDTFYAVSKITGEALGQLYSHKADMQVVVVRIGSCRARPTEPRHRATWLSFHDATALLHAAATRPFPGRYLLLHGTSRNSSAWSSPTGWDTLGYQPADSADEHPVPSPITDRHTGGSFADQPLPEHPRVDAPARIRPCGQR